MVKFFSTRIPRQRQEYIINEGVGSNKLLLQAEPRLVRNAVAYWIDSDKTLQYTIAGDGMAAEIADEDNLYLASATLEAGGGLLTGSDPETYRDVVTARTQRKEPATLLGIEADFPDNLKRAGFGEDNYNEDAIVNGILEWIKRNRKRVTLGYGPDHPLDDINPLAISETYVPRDDRDIVDNFSEWLRVITEDTAMSSNEHAFYVDENNNSIGVISGGRSSVEYPASQPGETSVSAHTHPTLKSLGFPSETDLRTNAFRCTEDSVEMIVVANSHSNFTLERETGDDESPEGGVAEYPFTEVPVAIVKNDEADTEREVKIHHRDQAGKIKTMLDQQLQHKKRGIEQVKPELSQGAIALLESSLDKASILRKKLVKDDKAVQSLNEVGVEENVKFTLEQEPLSL